MCTLEKCEEMDNIIVVSTLDEEISDGLFVDVTKILEKYFSFKKVIFSRGLMEIIRKIEPENEETERTFIREVANLYCFYYKIKKQYEFSYKIVLGKLISDPTTTIMSAINFDSNNDPVLTFYLPEEH